MKSMDLHNEFQKFTENLNDSKAINVAFGVDDIFLLGKSLEDGGRFAVLPREYRYDQNLFRYYGFGAAVYGGFRDDFEREIELYENDELPHDEMEAIANRTRVEILETVGQGRIENAQAEIDAHRENED